MNGFLTSCRLAHCSMKWAVPTTSSRNRSVGTTINEYYINQMVKDAENKSSLKFLHLTEARYGHCHNIWSSCGTEPFAVTMTAVKVKLAQERLLYRNTCRLAHCSMKWAVFSVSCLHIGQREPTSPFLANFALCSCRVSVPVLVSPIQSELAPWFDS
jgi:hypothetical protein